MHWTWKEADGTVIMSCIYKFLVNGSSVHVQIMNCYVTADGQHIEEPRFTEIKDSIIVESQDEGFPFEDGWRKAPRIHANEVYLYLNKKSEQLLIGKICGVGPRKECINVTGSRSEL